MDVGAVVDVVDVVVVVDVVDVAGTDIVIVYPPAVDAVTEGDVDVAGIDTVFDVDVAVLVDAGVTVVDDVETTLGSLEIAVMEAGVTVVVPTVPDTAVGSLVIGCRPPPITVVDVVTVVVGTVVTVVVGTVLMAVVVVGLAAIGYTEVGATDTVVGVTVLVTVVDVVVVDAGITGFVVIVIV